MTSRAAKIRSEIDQHFSDIKAKRNVLDAQEAPTFLTVLARAQNALREALHHLNQADSAAGHGKAPGIRSLAEEAVSDVEGVMKKLDHGLSRKPASLERGRRIT